MRTMPAYMTWNVARLPVAVSAHLRYDRRAAFRSPGAAPESGPAAGRDAAGHTARWHGALRMQRAGQPGLAHPRGGLASQPDMAGGRTACLSEIMPCPSAPCFRMQFFHQHAN